jgi:hypothetical protein
MVKQKDARFGNAAGDASDILDRDQMTERPLSEIHQTGPTAALDKCHALVVQINSRLAEGECEKLVRSVAELRAYLERAVAVSKKM